MQNDKRDAIRKAYADFIYKKDRKYCLLYIFQILNTKWAIPKSKQHLTPDGQICCCWNCMRCIPCNKCPCYNIK